VHARACASVSLRRAAAYAGNSASMSAPRLQVKAETCNFLPEAKAHRGKSEPLFMLYRVRCCRSADRHATCSADPPACAERDVQQGEHYHRCKHPAAGKRDLGPYTKLAGPGRARGTARVRSRGAALSLLGANQPRHLTQPVHRPTRCSRHGKSGSRTLSERVHRGNLFNRHRRPADCRMHATSVTGTLLEGS